MTPTRIPAVRAGRDCFGYQRLGPKVGEQPLEQPSRLDAEELSDLLLESGG